MAFITKEDLVPFADIEPAKADAMIVDAESMAVLTAPCLADLVTAPPDETPAEQVTRLAKLAAVKAILRGAILRWEEAGSGATSSLNQQAGPFGQQQSFTPAARKSMFWPSELEQLQGICSDGEQGKAYAIETVAGPTIPDQHSPFCNLRFGANWCSCGADIGGGFPIYEVLYANNEY